MKMLTQAKHSWQTPLSFLALICFYYNSAGQNIVSCSVVFEDEDRQTSREEECNGKVLDGWSNKCTAIKKDDKLKIIVIIKLR